MTSANLPSAPVPETAARRSAITRHIQAATGLNEAILERLVRSFYEAARRDGVTGHLFDDVRDWEKHIASITAFWSSVGMLTGRYHGQPLAAHLPLPLQPVHFARWLVLFEQTAREVCTDAGADHLLEKARRIASSLQMGVAVNRGRASVRFTGWVMSDGSRIALLLGRLLSLAFRQRIIASDVDSGIAHL
ncbi:MAG: group III truncated hemoglobin, partial [Acetobacteraceae bacterium]